MIKKTKHNSPSLFVKLQCIFGLAALILFATPQLSFAIPKSENEYEVHIELKEQDFSSTLDAISKQLGIKILFHAQKPKKLMVNVSIIAHRDTCGAVYGIFPSEPLMRF